MKLIVGLGNPGKEYINTRHNIGFMVIDYITNHLDIVNFTTKFNGEYAEYSYKKEKIIFLKPLKYMNLSGEVIKRFVDYYKIPIDNILIIHDDLDTSLGTVKLRYQGSSGGHNGLKNIELNLNTKKYKRLKIGISNNKNISTVDYVLGNFSKIELEVINNVLPKIANIFNDYLDLSFDNLMNKYNRSDTK